MGNWDAAEAAEDEAIDSREHGRGRFATGVPEDVAALYTWANVQGARYRDFSASRRVYREQVRARAAQALRQRELAGLPGARRSSALTEPAGRELLRSSGQAAGGRSGALARKTSSSDFAKGKPEVTGFPAQFLHSGRYRAADLVESPLETHSSNGELMWEPAPLRAPLEAPEENAAEVWASDRWERVDGPGGRIADPRPDRYATPFGDESVQTGPVGFGSGIVRRWEPRQGEIDNFEEEERTGPAWLYGTNANGRPSRPVPTATSADAEDGGRGAARWSALQDVFEHAGTEMRAASPASAGQRRAPLLLLFSRAGGVGKTSLLATLGRALSAGGERVAIGDTAAHSVLSFYFGARDLRPGGMRAFAPPEGSDDGPVFLVNYDLARRGQDPLEQRHLMGEILRNGSECNRIMLDMPADAEWLLRRMATMQPTVLVPLTPDMNSVIGLEAVERYFEGITDSDEAPLLPFYLLNQFDAGLALHLDVREVLRRRLGDRLLSFVIRRSPMVSEALAEGMTVVDYAPDSPVARDYFDVAAWLRMVSPPALSGMRAHRSGVL